MNIIGIVGITDHAANALGDVVFVDLPSKGISFSSGDSFGSVESVKAASDVYSPVSGEIIEANSLLETAPGTVNESPFEKGWFVKIKVGEEGKKQFDSLLDKAAYDKHIEDTKH
jgi:glycine cleavage system H protein